MCEVCVGVLKTEGRRRPPFRDGWSFKLPPSTFGNHIATRPRFWAAFPPARHGPRDLVKEKEREGGCAFACIIVCGLGSE